MAWPSDYPSIPTTKWICESSPTYRIFDVVGGVYINNLLFAPTKPINKDNIIAEAIRRAKNHAGAPQTIELQAGGQFSAPQVGGSAASGKGDHEYYAFWGGSTNGPFQPIEDVYIVTDEFNPATITDKMVFGSRIKGQNGTVITPGPMDNLHWIGMYWLLDANSGAYDYFITSQNANSTAYLDVSGLIGFWRVRFRGVQLWSGSSTDEFGRFFDCKTCVRAGFAAWKFYDCEFPTCGEHCLYLDAPQGGLEVIRCKNTSSFGDAQGCTGNTFMQIPQRGNHPIVQVNYGGLPGYGDIVVRALRTNGCCWNNSSSTVTIVGFRGTQVLLDDIVANNNHGGFITFWTAAADGGFTQFGEFTPQGNPNNYPAGGFTTRYAIIRNCHCTLSTPWQNPTAPFKFSGVQFLDIEDISCANLNGQRVFIAFWGIGGETSLGSDPFDNGSVSFRSPPLTQPISGTFIWPANSQKAVYKTTNITNPQLDALLNNNNAYPPGSGGGGGPGTPGPPGQPTTVISRLAHFRAGSRVEAAAFDASAGGRLGRIRTGVRVDAAAFDASAGGRLSKVRTGVRVNAAANAATVVTSKASKVRAGTRVSASATFEVNIPPEEVPRPGRVYLQRWQVSQGGSANGMASQGGSKLGQLSQGGSAAGEVNA